jgi:hypothetical protein
MMGKYVIESKFENTRCFLEVACENREPYFFINRVDSLTPYTEPDLEQVRKEAYQKGYETGYKDGYNEPGKNQQEAYQRGINDAREGKASCQFCRFTDVRQDMEPCASCSNNYDNKFEPEEQITKGDIVLIKSTPEVEILVTYADEEYVSGIALTEVDGNCEIGDQYTNIRICNVEKTGEHYEIAEVLQKMKES